MTECEFQKQLKKYHETMEMPVELAVKLLSECTTDGVYEEETEEAKFMAIKALEQESILDKIRDEIATVVINGQVDEHTMFIRTGEQVKQMALGIIDKYKAESEKV